MLKNDAKRLLRVAGLEIRRVQDHPRNSLTGVLLQLCRQGICPATVIDIGAAFGSWSQTCAGVFPQATYCLIEPIAEYEHALQQTTAKMPNAKYHIKAISNEHGEKNCSSTPTLWDPHSKKNMNRIRNRHQKNEWCLVGPSISSVTTNDLQVHFS